jgi:hypothetical protein
MGVEALRELSADLPQAEIRQSVEAALKEALKEGNSHSPEGILEILNQEFRQNQGAWFSVALTSHGNIQIFDDRHEIPRPIGSVTFPSMRR